MRWVIQYAWARKASGADRAEGVAREGAEPGQYPTHGTDPLWEEEDLAWNILLDSLNEQRGATMPRELVWGGACLGALLIVGVLWPLAALAAPARGTKSLFLVPWSLLIALFGALMYTRALSALRELKKAFIWSSVEGKYEQHLIDLDERERREGQTKAHAPRG